MSWEDPVRWWPETPEWIGRQLYEREAAKKQVKANEKDKIREQETMVREREQAAAFAKESRTHTGNDAWSDEEETVENSNGSG